MERITITLTEEMKGYVDGQISGGQYGNVSEYFRDLIRHEQEAKAKQQLEALLLEGVRSGETQEWTAETLKNLKRVVKDRADKKRA